MDRREIEMLLDQRDSFVGRKLRKEIRKVTDDTISELRSELAETITIIMDHIDGLVTAVKDLEARLARIDAAQ
jgi:hypothetical protein